MAEIPVSFELPDHLNVENFISNTEKKFPLQLTAHYSAVKTFYDSFDWRLYNAEFICEFNQAKGFSCLNLINYLSGQLISRIQLEKVPPFIAELKNTALTQHLLPLLEMRALLPIISLNLQIHQLNILNSDQKTIARLIIEEYECFKSRVILETVKGYDRTAELVEHFLIDTLALKVVTKSVLIAALKSQGRKPCDYSSKLTLKLDPCLSAAKAVKAIYSQLLQTIKLTQQGTINATDSEFLHDFRVAIRRTRAGLSQLKAASPPEITRRYSDYFAWLGQITSLTRDLDVYLLNFEHYKNNLPLSMREDLNPLRDFLKLKQTAAQKELAAQLKSKKYLSSLLDWEHYLKQLIPETQNQTASIKQLADLRIWKVYQRVIKQGSAINDQSAAVALHDLRKTCKKLRYLIEFFQSLYPLSEIKVLLKSLKELQELLGDFQDCAIQEQTLRHFSEEIMNSNSGSSQTLLAIGILVQMLDTKRCKARSDFGNCFAVFAAAENCAIFKSLFVNKV